MIKRYTCHILDRVIVLILICLWGGINIFAQNPVRKIEYFLNTDPGHGKAINVPITAGTDIDVTFDIATSGLPSGLHLLGFRGYNGKSWSQTYTRIIAISPTGVTVEAIEYFWDTDPGKGKATRIDCALEGDEVSIDFDALCENVTPGVHTLGIRACSNGVWSQAYLRSVVISESNYPLEAIEYYWDTDPGVGKATRYECQMEGNNIVVDFEALCNELSPGIHLIGIRACSYGAWSNTYTRTVAVYPSGNPFELVEYYWDTDPGKGSGTPLAFTQAEGYAQIDVDNIPTEDLEPGEHLLVIRAKAAGVWSLPTLKTVHINGNPSFSLPADTVCAGQTFKITNLTTGTIPGTTYEWDMNGDGTADSKADTEFEYSYTDPGVYTITLKAIAEGCITSCSKEITVLSVENPTVKLTPENGLFCPGSEAIFMAIAENAGDKPVYRWYLNGTAVTETTDTYTLVSPQEGDVVKVIVETSNLCSNLSEVEAELTIHADELPEVTLAHYFPVYNSEKAFALTGGLPAGGKYYINGVETETFDPSANALGKYTVTYRVTNSNGCFNEASQTFTLLDGATLSGDINKDGVVDIYDVLCAVNIIYGIVYPTYNLGTADLNGDGIVNVEDLVGIVGIITAPYNSARSAWPSSANTRNNLIVNNVTGTPGSVVRASVSLDAQAWVSGAQFDITLPEGVKAESASKDVVVGRKPSTDSNTYTILSYSMSLGQLPEKLMLNLTLPETLLSGDYRIEIANGVLADRNMKNVITRAEGGTLQIVPTGINQPDDTSIQVISGNKCIEVFRATGAAITVYDMGGRLVSTLRKAKDVERIAAQAGMYIVKVVAEGSVNEFKVMIK